jgi:hypothetical protein
VDVNEFKKSLEKDAPPSGLGLALEALWYAGKGDWDTAHERAQEEQDRDGSWVHAHLHRQEGDADNAAYWYRLAGRPVTRVPISEEWLTIVETMLASL